MNLKQLNRLHKRIITAIKAAPGHKRLTLLSPASYNPRFRVSVETEKRNTPEFLLFGAKLATAIEFRGSLVVRVTTTDEKSVVYGCRLTRESCTAYVPRRWRSATTPMRQQAIHCHRRRALASVISVRSSRAAVNTPSHEENRLIASGAGRRTGVTYPTQLLTGTNS
jgi:hypothetical protein